MAGEIVDVKVVTRGFDYVVVVTEKVAITWKEEQFDPISGRTVEVTMHGRETKTREAYTTSDPDTLTPIVASFRRQMKSAD